MKLLPCFLVMAAGINASLLQADMSLDRSIVYFDKKGWKRQDVQVSNLSSDPLYLQTEVYRVINPGRENEERIQATSRDEMKLMATPHKSSIKAGGERVVRLFNREKKLNEEKVYRVLFRPVVGPNEEQKQVVKVLVAYEILVFIRPLKPVFNVDGEIKKNKLELNNTGNSNVVLRRGVLCKTKNDCKPLWQSKRLYSGQSWNVDLPEEGEVKFALFDGHYETSQSIKPQTIKQQIAKQ